MACVAHIRLSMAMELITVAASRAGDLPGSGSKSSKICLLPVGVPLNSNMSDLPCDGEEKPDHRDRTSRHSAAPARRAQAISEGQTMQR